MRCPKIPLLPILPGLFPAHEWTAVLTSSRFDVNARIVVYRCRCLFVCLFVCLLFTDTKAFSKTKGRRKKKSIQRRRRRTKEKRIEAIASFKKENRNTKTPQASCEQPNSIPLRNKQYTERLYYWGGRVKNQTPATIATLASLFFQQHQKRVW